MLKKVLNALVLMLVAFGAVWAFFFLRTTVDGREMTMLEASFWGLEDLNVWMLLLLFPEQLLAHYSAGRVYLSFFRRKRGFKEENVDMGELSSEINLANLTMSNNGPGNLKYLKHRLQKASVSEDDVTLIHTVRNVVCALMDTLQIWIAAIVVLFARSVRGWLGYLALLVALLAAIVIDGLLLLVWWFSKDDENYARAQQILVKIGGHLRLSEEWVVEKMAFWRGMYERACDEVKILWRSIIWAVIFSFLEIGAFWLVGGALGVTTFLAQLMLAESVASLIGSLMITPSGIGGYEGAMIAMMVAMGAAFPEAVVIVLVARVCILVGAVVSGWGPYQKELTESK